MKSDVQLPERVVHAASFERYIQAACMCVRAAVNWRSRAIARIVD